MKRPAMRLPPHMDIQDRRNFADYFDTYYVAKKTLRKPWLLYVELLYNEYEEYVGAVIGYTSHVNVSHIFFVLILNNWTFVCETESHRVLTAHIKRRTRAVMVERYGCFWCWPLNRRSRI